MTRIERAARAMYRFFQIEWDEDPWDLAPKVIRDEFLNQAEAVLLAAEPELYQDPPQAWRAPMHLSDAMITAAEAKVSHMDKETGELVNFDFVQVDRMWRALRDAHLKGGMANAGSS